MSEPTWDELIAAGYRARKAREDLFWDKISKEAKATLVREKERLDEYRKRQEETNERRTRR